MHPLRQRLRFTASLLAVLIFLGLLTPGTAAASQAAAPTQATPGSQPLPGPDLEEMALQLTADQNAEAAYLYLLTEVAILMELGALPSGILPELDDLRSLLRLDEISREDLLIEAFHADHFAHVHSLEAEAKGFEFYDEEIEVLDEMPIDEYVAVQQGRQMETPALAYLLALEDLWDRGYPYPTEITITTADDMVLVINFGSSGATTAPPPSDGQETDPPPDSDDQGLIDSDTNDLGLIGAGSDRTLRPWVLPTGGGILLVAFGLLFVRLRRRRFHSSEAAAISARQVPQLLEVGRQMTASHSESEIASIAVDQSMLLLQAAAGAFIATKDGHHEVLYCSSRQLLSVENIDQSLIAQVMQTGQQVSRIAKEDPALHWLPAAVLLTPVIANGTVDGVLFLGRDSTRPFQGEHATLATQLAPMIGSALQSARDHSDVVELANVDGLTQLGNRRRLDTDLNRLVASHHQESRPVTFAMFDVDHFKAFNDTNGHAAGDVALRQVADLARAHVRPEDIVYRYGGEEFCIILPDTTLNEAVGVAERVRAAIETEHFPGEKTQPSGRITVSVGLATAESDDPLTLIKAADAALYRAKEGGRNRVELATL